MMRREPQNALNTDEKATLDAEGLQYMVAMEMSKSTKPRHFSDSSREHRDKNRHEQRTKSYLKKKREKKVWMSKEEKAVETLAHVCSVQVCVFMSVCHW